jgi:uncharacterized protein (DUF2141 family)
VRALAVIVAAQLLSCGGDPQKCDNNNCTLPGATTVKWIFDHYPALLFPNDSCNDMGAFMVHVEVTKTDDPTVTAAMDGQCANAQVTFLGLEAGTYNVAVTPLDINGAPLVSVAAMDMVIGGTSDTPTTITVNVPYTAWTGTYTGTFYFRLMWGGQSCEATTPPIATQVLTLTAGGHVVTAVTDTGQKLDGTDPQACRKLSEATAQFAEGIPFGPATFVVVGKDSAGTVQFSNSFDTFVGAAKNNPEIDFPVLPPDAGVDAAPMADASVD